MRYPAPIRHFPALTLLCMVNTHCFAEETTQIKGYQALWKDGIALSNQPEREGNFNVPAQGYVVIKDTLPDNFSLSFELVGSMMPGVAFRADDALNSYEYIYFRVYPGADEKETVQYIPTFNGEMSWQLYNYPDYEAHAELQENVPFNVRLVVVKNKAALYLNDSQSPAMVIDPLLTGRKSGHLLFTSISKAATVRNVVVQPVSENTEMPVAQGNSTAPSGTLTDWLISGQFECENSSFIFECANALKSSEKARHVKSNEQGVVNLSRYFQFPGKWVRASTTINAERNKHILLEYDYTHEVAIFLNGKPVFTGKEIDRENGNFGRVIPGEENITLPLVEGENTVSFFVHGDDQLAQHFNAQRFGRFQARNWGFTARVASTDE